MNSEQDYLYYYETKNKQVLTHQNYVRVLPWLVIWSTLSGVGSHYELLCKVHGSTTRTEVQAPG